ncbi:MAG: hypothetical protein ABSG08_11850 [Terriglobales bacterium]|jgi:hypothetical protein
MSLNHSETSRKKGAVRGRESRNQSLNTKLTKTELAAVEAASEADGRALGEWVREAVLKASRASSVCVATDDLMTEIVALQLFLTDVLSPVACGERMSAEQYQKLMRNVKTNKQRAAREVIAQYIAESEENRRA